MLITTGLHCYLQLPITEWEQGNQFHFRDCLKDKQCKVKQLRRHHNTSILQWFSTPSLHPLLTYSLLSLLIFRLLIVLPNYYRKINRLEIYLQVLENPLPCKYTLTDFDQRAPPSNSNELMHTQLRQVQRESTFGGSGEGCELQ